MELSYKEEVSVGAMVIGGLLAFIVAMFWLTGRSATRHGIPVQAMFADVGGLKEGDPVRVSGVKKGQVVRVRLMRMGKVLVTLQLDPEVRPHADATATVASADFLGAKYVEYNPGAKDELFAAGQPIPGVVDAGIADAAAKAANNANALLENLNKGLNAAQLSADIHNTLIATQRGMEALTQTAKGPVIDRATATLQAVERVMSRLDTVLGSASPTNTGRRLDTLTANLTRLTGTLSAATTSLSDVLGKISRGDGTFGRMATDTMLYKNLSSTLASLTALLNDLKERPGRYLTVKVF
jgi:phospholipid/cholesterol/gamma-HCH transport system substrate-binding protein